MATSPTQLIRRGHADLTVPRRVHPVAWWLWALGLAVAASRTTNPLLSGAVIAVACWVVAARRSDSPWARAFRYYLVAAAFVVVIRVCFRVLFGGGIGDHVLLPLPELPLPDSAGITLLGDVTLEALLGGLYDGLRLAAMLVCIGAANALANPKRLLRSMPPALHEVSTAVVVALSAFPQLAESVLRVRRARRLRPDSDLQGLRGLRSLVVPVLEDALDRSLLLAASMDSRGYGRSGDRSRAASWLVGSLMLVGLIGICVGAYGLLDATSPALLSTPMLLLGVGTGVAGLVFAGHGVRRSTYRPDRWALAESLVVGSGAVAALSLVLARDSVAALHPSVSPPAWPTVPWGPLIGILVALLPAVLTPPPEPVDGPAGLRTPEAATA